ncbi:MAG: hypothetical protein EAZ38_15030, partial [Cytophagales bacterium]
WLPIMTSGLDDQSDVGMTRDTKYYSFIANLQCWRRMGPPTRASVVIHAPECKKIYLNKNGVDFFTYPSSKLVDAVTFSLQ